MASEHKRAIGIFPDRLRTASALQALKDSGFSMRDVSVIARDADREAQIAGVEVQDNVSNQADKGGVVGAFTGGVLGGIAGLLVGLGTLAIPGVGPVLLAGEAATVVTTLIGAAGGAVAGGLVGALIGLGIPEHRARQYSDRVNRGEYLLMLKGTDDEIYRAEQVLQHHGIQDWGVYAPPQQYGSEQTFRQDADVHHSGYVPPHPGNIPLQQGSRDAVPYAENPYPGLTRHYQPTTPDSPRVNEPLPNQPYPNQERYPDQERYAQPMGMDPTRTRESSRIDHPMDQPHYEAVDPVTHRTRGRAIDHQSYVSDPAAASVGLQRCMIGIFLDRPTMENALNALQGSGFPMHKITLAMRDDERSGYPESRTGQPLGGLTGLLAGLNRVNVPRLGSVLVAGSDGSGLVDAARHDQIRSLSEALTYLGIPEEHANLYGRHIASGAYLVTLRGTDVETHQAAATLGRYGMRDWGVYDVHNPSSHPGSGIIGL